MPSDFSCGMRTKPSLCLVTTNSQEKSEGVEYPDAWLRRILAENPDQFKLPVWEEEAAP